MDTGAYVAEDGGGLEQRDAVFGVRERVSRGEAAEACADDDDVETKASMLDGGIFSRGISVGSAGG